MSHGDDCVQGGVSRGGRGGKLGPRYSYRQCRGLIVYLESQIGVPCPPCKMLEDT